MRKIREKSGFTMVELLIVVAILGVLAGVSFIAVQNHQRSLAQLEKNTIAKEIYFAAQNHLSMASGQGYLGVSQYGHKDTDETYDVYYLVSGDSDSAAMLDIMLPFGAIEETVRAGSYLIRYQPSSATVLDVFYCSPTGNPDRFNHSISVGEYNSIKDYKVHGMPGSGYVVGWYGGGDAIESGIYIEAPTVKIKNEDQLIVEVDCPDYNGLKDKDGKRISPIIELIISGEKHIVDDKEKIARAVILLQNPEKDGFVSNERVSKTETGFSIIIDDITTEMPLSGDGMHFADLKVYHQPAADTTKIWFMPDEGTTDKYTDFRPGENITVEAVAFSNKIRTNIAYSSAETANSIFANYIDATTDDETIGLEDEDSRIEVRIANVRHLENLDPTISGFDYEQLDADADGVHAVQTEDIIWTGFMKGTKPSVYKLGDELGSDKSFVPVNPTYSFSYDGRDENNVQHNITEIKVDLAEQNVGLFGELKEGHSVSNLELIDFSIETTKTSGNAGALAGGIKGSTIKNVLVRNPVKTATTRIVSAGIAGGLIGKMEDGKDSSDNTVASDVSVCAASVIVSGATNAGGLIGASSGGSVTACYSGGHTVNKENSEGVVIGVWYGDYENSSNTYNVTAENGIAGGLIGAAGTTEIKCSYSTCSAKGITAGGFVGTSEGKISNCYATGLVRGTGTESITVGGETMTIAKDGAFAYSVGTNVTSCNYFKIINERREASGNYIALTALGKSSSNEQITAFDRTAASYNGFVPEPSKWTRAEDCISTLKDYYGEGSGDDRIALYNLNTVAQLIAKYNLNTVDKLGAITEKTDPSDTTTVEDFVATHYGDWPAPEIFVVNVPTP